jgi:hypothetical protein
LHVQAKAEKKKAKADETVQREMARCIQRQSAFDSSRSLRDYRLLQIAVRDQLAAFDNRIVAAVAVEAAKKSCDVAEAEMDAVRVEWDAARARWLERKLAAVMDVVSAARSVA